MANTNARQTNQVYGDVENESDLRRIYADIRQEVDYANSRSKLTELYRRAAYLITLTYSPAWDSKFGEGVQGMRKVAASEFATLANKINGVAKRLGTLADYDDKWGATT